MSELGLRFPFFFLFIEFIGVTLVNKIIQVSSTHAHRF